MAHHTAKSGYKKLTERINRFPQGAPPSELLYKILGVLMDDEEARLAALLPIKPFTLGQAARRWKLSRDEARKVLDGLASRAVLLDIDFNGKQKYVLPPPMAGFFEFSLMRIRDDVDQKLLSQLFHEYLNVEEDFVRELFTGGETGLGRVFVSEPALSPENELHVLDYERASEVVHTASHIGVGVCYCRHKMEHQGTDCDAPKNICMTFNTVGAALIKQDYVRQVDVAEGIDLLQKAQDHGLVQFGENNRESVSFICNCCGCCCEALLAARRFAFHHTVHPTNFLPVIADTCKGCGRCARACPVEALRMVSANDPARPKKLRAQLEPDLCLGCAVCVPACRHDSLSLTSRPERVITPLDTAHRTVVMAIERGKLPEFIFDNDALASHRAMAAILGVILRLPPWKQTLANKQVKSRYLEAIVSRVKF